MGLSQDSQVSRLASGTPSSFVRRSGAELPQVQTEWVEVLMTSERRPVGGGVPSDTVGRIQADEVLREVRLLNEQIINAEHMQADEALRKSENRLAFLVQATPAVIYTAKASGDFGAMFVSANITSLTGYAPSEFVENSGFWVSRTHPDDLPRVMAELERLPERGEVLTEYRFRYKDGSYHWVQDGCRLTRDAHGAPEAVVGYWLDITERKQAEEALWGSERQLRAVLDGMPLMGVILDRAGVVTMCNDSLLALTGWERGDVLNRNWFTLFLPPEIRDQVHGLFLEAVVSGGTPDRFENEIVTRTGARRLILWSNTVLRDGNGLVAGVASIGDDITERKRAGEALRQSEERYRALFDRAGEGIFFMTLDGTLVAMNDAFARMHGYSAAEMLHLRLKDLDTPETFQRVPERMARIRDGEGITFEVEHYHRDGHVFPLEVSASLAAVGGESYIQCFHRDITERKCAEAEKSALETQLRQAQKLESVGRLAGGVAHDFNNLLSGIMGYVELCRDELPPEHPIRSYLDEIATDAQRSANITQQLLAFARKQIIAPKMLDLNDALVGMLKLLRHLMGEDIAANWMPGTHLWPVKIDPGQLDQILANLCVNARDAIAGVGKVTIETANATLDEAYCATHTDATAGEYVRLAVSDSGCGMSKDVLDHIFEPFYTTKEVGKGTGLGLATVYGIVQQNHGHLEVQSEVGKGTTFNIYLPRATSEADPGSATVTPARLPRGTETVLLAEDEKSVRITARLFLEALGYTVLAAKTPEEALCLAGAHSGPIHLLIADVIMPGMNGPDLAGLVAEECPNLKCLFMSGYTADVILHRGMLNEGMPFMPKPFSRYDLACKVREVLDRQ